MSALMILPFLAGKAWVARAWCTANQVSYLAAACAVWHPTIGLQPLWPGHHCPRGWGEGVSMLSALGSASWPTASLCVVGKRWERLLIACP